MIRDRDLFQKKVREQNLKEEDFSGNITMPFFLFFFFFFINTDQNLRGSIPFAQIKKKNKLALALNNLKFRTIGFWLLQSSKI